MDPPSTGREWISLSPDLQFQPAHHDDAEEDPRVAAALRAHTERLLIDHTGSYSGYENQFADGSGTYYNDYAQAWRLIGFYIDCNAPFNNVNECYDNGGGGGGGGGNNNENGEPACQRFLMWAAVSAEWPICSYACRVPL